MRRFIPLLLLAAVPASAQTPPATIGDRYIPAPWWMREPVIAALGLVRTELPANRARFSVQFSAVEREVDAANAAAARRVVALDGALRTIGADKLRLATTFGTRPLYDQYRDRDGRVQENARSDKIDRYEVTATIEVEVRDVALLEKIYATVLAAKPDGVNPVSFQLEPDNELKRALADEAVRDAARRARAAAEAVGTRLGAVKIIDPTARVCRTDVFAGWPNYGGEAARPTDVTVTGARTRDYSAVALPVAAPPPPPAPASGPQVTLQPPLLRLQDEACVVFALP